MSIRFVCVRATALAVVSVMLAFYSPDADAQDVAAPTAPRALFGADRRDPERRDQLDVSMFFNVTNDSDRSLDNGGQPVDQPELRHGAYSAVEGLLSYRRQNGSVAIAVDTRSAVQYHPLLHDSVSDHAARVAVRFPVRRQTELSASQQVTYFQSYQLPSLSPAAAGSLGFSPISDTPHAVSRLAAYTSATTLRVVETLSQRSSLEADYEFQSVNFTGGAADLQTWGLRGRFAHRVSRSVVLQFGYGQRVGRYLGSASAQKVRIHDFDLGPRYSRSLSRSMTLSVSPGSSIVESSKGTQYRPAGEMTLTRRLGRNWNAHALYRRNAQFVEGFAEPVFLDSTTAGVAGYLGSRVELGMSGAYSTGAIGSSTGARYTSYSSSGRASVAINRQWAVALNVLYYEHRFDGGITIPTAAALNRHSVRIGLRWWKPVR